MVKKFEDYVVGDIVKKGKNTYEVVLKTVKKRYSKGAGQYFYDHLLYLKALDSLDNRIGKVNSRGTLSFETDSLWGSRSNRTYYKKWTDLPVLV